VTHNVRTTRLALTGGILTPVPPDSGWASGRDFQLGEEEITIGRGQHCDIRINHPQISQHHADICPREDGYYLVRRNATSLRINNLPVQAEKRLQTNDIITLAAGVLLSVNLYPASEDAPTQRDISLTRQLATILSADLVGYTELMFANPEWTIRKLLNDCQGIFIKEIEACHGHFYERRGDNFLAIFSTSAPAIRCAIAVQESLREFNRELPGAQQLRFRVGVNAGVIVTDPGGEIGGDAINFADAIQKLAEPGGISVSRGVVDEVAGELRDLVTFEQAGFCDKDVSRKIEVYQLRPAHS
jgi:class 3 adenylate cyclase